MKRSYIGEIKADKDVLLKGWVYEVRNLSKLGFVALRDMTGIVQCVVKGDLVEKLNELTPETAIEIIGKVKTAKIKAEYLRDDVEVEVKEMSVINKANPLPIHVNEKTTSTSFAKRLDYRFLDVRKPEVQAIFKIESTLISGFREFMEKEKSMEAIFPSVISASSEGGTELYHLKYFEKDAYLSQSCQLYKQMIACAVEKVHAVFTVWRAEKHNTPRHLNEARQLDFEMGFADEFDAMDVMARCVKFIIKKINKVNKRELKILGVELKEPKVKYMTFNEVNELLKKKGVDVEEKDLTGDGEKKLGEIFPDTIVFVHDWPISGKPFYIMPKNDGLSHGFDAIYKGVEITSGGQRVHIPEILEKQLRERGLEPKDFESYIDAFRYGAPPHAGWGMGVERLMMLLLNRSNIREVVLFPRDRERLTP